jgi:GntR family transcriptional regulator, transcriptional repressor for pyruvate dehydrogenase complex
MATRRYGSRAGGQAAVRPLRPGVPDVVRQETRGKGADDMNVTDQAVAKIKAKIASGELAPGSRLPRMDDLAVQLGLSRNSLREAVRELTATNILISRQGDGTYVSSLKVDTLFEALAAAAEIVPDETALQLLRLREIVEPPAVALAAVRATEFDVRQLRAVLDHAGADATDEEFVQADLAFHRRLLELSGDASLAALVRALSPEHLHQRSLCGGFGEHGRRWVREDHDRILEALAAQDLEAARAAARVHVVGMRRRLEERLQSDQRGLRAPAVPA